MNKPLLLILSILFFPFIIIAQIPSGIIASYQLDNNAVDTSSNSFTGSLSSTTATTNRFNNINSATAFTTGSSLGILPQELVMAVKDDFTVCFWFKTTMNAWFADQWYGGNALVDAEVCGGTTDWGTALIDGGKVSFGIGNPDITIKSSLGNYNDGNWHFVSATRNKTDGTIILYVDGVQVAASSGTTTSSLTAPNSIRLGSNPCAPNCVYTGNFDDIILYNRVLTSTEISTMYLHMSGIVLPLKWISFNGELVGNTAKLQWQVEAIENNDHFEIEYSANGNDFSKKGISIKDGGERTDLPGRILYSFLDQNLSKGLNFYRIRQVDKDGRFTLSKTIQLRVNTNFNGFYLRSNPVADELILVNANRNEVKQILVADITGRMFINRFVKSTESVITTEVGKLQPGYYLLKIISANSNVTIPWIKQ